MEALKTERENEEAKWGPLQNAGGKNAGSSKRGWKFSVTNWKAERDRPNSFSLEDEINCW